jgi:hypothetical protein
MFRVTDLSTAAWMSRVQPHAAKQIVPILLLVCVFLSSGCNSLSGPFSAIPVADVAPESTIAAQETAFIAEGLPVELHEAVEKLNLEDRRLVTIRGRSEYVVSRKRIWPCGSTVTVAFKGGSPSLRRGIAEAIADWTRASNVKLDFGSANAGFRNWNPADTSYSAQIRISFDDPDRGYWSLIGSDSVNPRIVRAGKASMNFHGFAEQLPTGWRSTVLHEFGHALGFLHEHQFPAVGCDFRFDDDPGYVPTVTPAGVFVQDSQGRRPGLYTYLSGEPNKWSSQRVDFNLRMIPSVSDAFRTSASLDRSSIMKYFFKDWFFKSGATSACYTAGKNEQLSPGDLQGARWAYPPACP